MDIPWPRTGDQLFKAGGHGALRAMVVTGLSVAATGYKDGADALVERLSETGRNDALIFPIVFCYRQYLELKLKAVGQILRVLSAENFRKIHDLNKLWEPVREALAAKLDPSETGPLDAVAACIAEMNSIHPGSVAFGYPEFEDVLRVGHQIDLANLMSVMMRVAAFLDAAEDAVESSGDSAV